MKDLSGVERAKKNAAEKACELVGDGMIVGLGTGSTAAYAIRCLGRRIEAEDLDILGVPTSYGTEALAIECGVPLTTLDEWPELDVDIDGADQIDASLNVIKGGGGAHVREKIVACAARQFVIVADGSKLGSVLDMPVPVEVMPFARRPVVRALERLGGKCKVRVGSGKDGPVISDNGGLIIDCDFGPIPEPAALGEKLAQIPGLVDHGIFTNVDTVYLGREDRVEALRKKA